MGKLFKDLSDDYSSGALTKFLAFVFAVEVGILFMALGVAFSDIMVSVGALLAVSGVVQLTQSLTGNGFGAVVGDTTQGVQTGTPSVGMLSNPLGNPDAARIIKLASLFVGWAILNIAAIWFKGTQGSIGNANQIAGIFFALCTAQQAITAGTGT